MKGSVDAYYQGEPTVDHMGRPNEHVPRVSEAARIIRDVIVACNSCYKRGRELTYESLFDVAQQARDDYQFVNDNSALSPFHCLLQPKVKDILAHRNGLRNEKWKYDKLLTELCTYIQCVVWHELEILPSGFDGYNFLLEAVKDDSIRKCVGTLNHDTVLEAAFEDSKLPFTVGFGPRSGDLSFWNPELFNEEGVTPVFKLHGTINCFRYQKDPQKQSSVLTAICHSNDPWHARDSCGHMCTPFRASPPLVIGDIVTKERQYREDIFADIFTEFNSCLRDTDAVVTVGYSWRDKAINAELLSWIEQSERKLVITVNDCDRFLRHCRFGLTIALEKYERDGRISLHECRAEELKWADIKERVLN